MKVILDIECNSLVNPLQIWVIVCKDIETNELHIFRKVTQDAHEKQRFLLFAEKVDKWVGHNILGYDVPVIHRLLGLAIDVSSCIDTLILSKLHNYSRKEGHSLKSYGEEFGLSKIDFNDFKQYSQEMEDYCVRDVEINNKVYLKYLPMLDASSWSSSIDLEQRFQLICNDLHNRGFAFNIERAEKLLSKVEEELGELDGKILRAFPPRQVKVKEFTPRATKFGTIAKNSVPRSLQTRLHEFEIGKLYPVFQTVEFNPSSHKQLINVLTEAGWRPEDKTTTHILTEREYRKNKSVDLKNKLVLLSKSGWKVNETNLSTLPDTAPKSARLLAKRILLESRRRTLVEWLSLVSEDRRIHGKFYGMGAWTHRMAHQEPNTANIPRPLKEDGSVKLLGKELRSLWIAPKGRLLVGVDAEGIQLRIFAHYIDDPEFTKALVEGKKSDKTDPHSLNQRILGDVCKSRQSAKRFIYALLLGAGIGKLAQILETSEEETKRTLHNLLSRYNKWKYLREEVFPKDAKRGYFLGLDGRKVPLPGEALRDRQHLAMSGYLQNGEAIIIKRSCLITDKRIKDEGLPWFFVDVVHDELQSETDNNLQTALRVAEIKAKAIEEAGAYYSLKCPMAGSYWNEDNKDYTIGTNWYQTH